MTKGIKKANSDFDMLLNGSDLEINEYRNELDRIYEKTQDTTLLFIKLLDFLLFLLYTFL